MWERALIYVIEIIINNFTFENFYQNVIDNKNCIHKLNIEGNESFEYKSITTTSVFFTKKCFWNLKDLF